MTESPLAGVRVVELGQMVAAPYCAKILADLGADVIKVEPPGGDAARRRGPSANDTAHPEPSGLFLYLNTNKQGITLDPCSHEGARLFRELCRGVDVLVEDTPPGWLAQWGIGDGQLSAANPRLIVASITPFGQDGPHRDWKAYPLNTWFGSGEGYFLPVPTPDGEPATAREPVQAGGMVGEYRCGMSAATAILLALCWQQATGQGQQIDISKQEALLALSRYEICKYPNDGFVERRDTRASPSGGLLPCRDGWVDVHFTEDHQWRALVQFLGHPEWGEDERFGTRGARAEHRDELVACLEPELLRYTPEEIYHGAQRLGCPAGPITDPADLLASPQLGVRGFFLELEHPEGGRWRQPGVPYQFSATPCALRRPAPSLGEHNDLVWGQELGLASDELARLRQAGVI